MKNDQRFSNLNKQMESINSFLVRLLLGQLNLMGLLVNNSSQTGDFKVSEIKALYHKWLEESLSVLKRNDALKAPSIHLDEVWKEWDQRKVMWLEDKNLKSQVVLVEATLRVLPEILTGKLLVTDVMFPKGSMKLVEGIYKHNQVADYFNEVLSDAVIDHVKNKIYQDSNVRIRLLEIGAGTGGSSSIVLEKLKPYSNYIQEYCYTDISKAFLKHGELQYGSQNEFLTFKVLNIEEPIIGQGIDVGGYDLVIAANVLHATRNIRQTLRKAKSIIRNNGLILLNEITDSSLFTHLTFGLLEGWWKYEDSAVRIPGCPGLYPEQWKKSLEIEGFRKVYFPTKDVEELGQQIIIAESDGIVQVKQKSSQHIAPAKVGSNVIKDEHSTQTFSKEKNLLPQAHVKNVILEKLSECLRVKTYLIQNDESFSDYGIDSITGVQLVQSINKSLRIELESTDLFDYSSVNQLTTYILTLYKDVIISELSQNMRRIDNELEKNLSSTTNLHEPLLERFPKGRRLENPINGTTYEGESTIEDVQVTDQMIETYIKDNIIRGLSDLLKMDVYVIHNDDSFSDYGVDSITGVQLVQRINMTLKIELETTDLYDYSSVDQLTRYIKSRYKSLISSALSQRTKQIEPSYDLGHLGYSNSKQEMHDIAIIGMSGRFANSKNVDDLWDHLSKGRDLIQEVSRWDLSQYYDQGTKYCNHGSFLDDIEQFDPLFFNITGLEATYMDPQQRIFLEESWKALEDAGYAGTTIQGKSCGVYVGCGPSDYEKLIGDNPPAQAFWGNASSIIPARVSYYLDLQGPAIAVDTACSSSLVAIHLACQGLLAKETEMALAGGIFIQTTPIFYRNSERAGMLSPTGRCHAFDDKADGFVPGEGAGVVVLKRLADAISDGDHIYGVIRGTAINQDGFTNGITAPSARSQERLEQVVYDTCGIHPEQIQMVEAHGTGTQLGDPIEYKALTRAFSKYTDKKKYCALGTIKTNIGHTQYASGVAGLIKILLSIKHKQIVPSLHYQNENKNIKTANSPFYVNTKLREWSVSSNMKRTAAISSFGFSGTNAHMVIEEASNFERVHSQKPGYLIVLSARTEVQLRQQVLQLVEHCNKLPQIDCGNLSYTLFLGRRHMSHRVACVVRNQNEFVMFFEKWLEKSKVPQIFTSISNNEQRETEELKQYGNECIQNSKNENNESNYYEYLSVVADLYVRGYQLEFKELFADEKYSKISLPTYPFGREAYWAPQINTNLENNLASKSNNSLNPTHISENRKFAYVTKQWESSLIRERKKTNGTIAILTTDETKELAQCLYQFFPGAYILNIHDLQSDIQQPEHLWKKYSGCIDLIGCGTEEILEIEWISWIQRLIEYGNRENLMILCVTKELESYQNKTINLVGASRVGLFRMLQSEYSYVRSRHMDGEFSANDRFFAEQISAEFLANNEDTEVCYRNGKRYRAFLNEIEEAELEVRDTQSFPYNHVLWITGGTKGLGLLCAKHFVDKYGVKQLVLSGREVLPPREQWDFFKSENTSVAKKIRSIQDIEDLGVEVFVLSVDLSDVQAMRASVESVKRFMGPIGGVIHCAGLADLENIAFTRKSPDVIGKVLNPKVHGLDVMYQSFMNEPLQFFVLYSSVSAIIPTLGSGISDYAMANAYMDYFSESKADDCPIVSIQWSSWKDVGIGEVKSNAYKQTGMLSMSNEEGLYMLDCILTKKRYSVVLPALVDSYLWEPKKLMQRRIIAVESSDIPDRMDTTLIGKSGNDLMNQTQSWLISLFSKELRIDALEFGPDIKFQQYGMDSILLAQVITRMDFELKHVALDPSIILEYPTMESLALYLADSYPEVLEAFFTKAVEPSDIPNIRGSSLDVSQNVKELMNQTQNWLISLFSKELRIDASEFGPDIKFQQYGMDSILLAQVITRMDFELKHVALDPSIILEYPTMRSLAVYLTDTYPEVLGVFFFEDSATKTHEKPIVNHEKLVKNYEKEKEKNTNPQQNIHLYKDKIAVIGIDCQFPDAINKSEYWGNLKHGRDSIGEAPTYRWDISDQYSVGNSAVSKVGGFLKNIEDFDPEYFQISESLALQIDPLQRKILECGAGAISDAGYVKAELWNKQVGVFIGARTSKYHQKLGKCDKDTIIGIGQNFIAAHLSHVYNFKGPNMIIDTACSSSLTAIHMAVKSIQNGESEIALAGGVDIILDESIYALLSVANILSPDGRCKAFSADANGIGVGEGCGIVILKPLQEAIRDNNKIYGVIDGSAINNDGNTMGITTPNPEAQKELIEKAVLDAKINPETISYVETHGTGTLIGDPIELKALTNVFSRYTFKKQYCGVGSVKSNIGHLICAAGVASFIKVLLALVHRELPATLHCDNPNPRFNFNDSPFYIVQDLKKWTSESHILRAGISSFGLGGNNAHLIVSNEGIPITHQASLYSSAPAISFNRKRYWPESLNGQHNRDQIITQGETEMKKYEELMVFFDSVEVE